MGSEYTEITALKCNIIHCVALGQLRVYSPGLIGINAGGTIEFLVEYRQHSQPHYTKVNIVCHTNNIQLTLRVLAARSRRPTFIPRLRRWSRTRASVRVCWHWNASPLIRMASRIHVPV